MSLYSILYRNSYQLEYLLVELLTRMPFSNTLKWLFFLRGILNFLTNRDWRNLLDSSISVRKQSALVLNVPEYSMDTLCRFISYSLEEYEILNLRNSTNMKMQLCEIEKKCKVLFKKYDSFFKHKNNFAMFSLHYGSFTFGILALRSIGLPIYVLGSNVVNSPLLPSSVCRFFQIKYQTMNKFLNGGEVLFFETQKKYFFSKLSKGSICISLLDLLAVNKNSYISINIFDQIRDVQAGLAHYAHKKNIPLGFFICRRKYFGEFIIDIKIAKHDYPDVRHVMQGLLLDLDKITFPKRYWLIADTFFQN